MLADIGVDVFGLTDVGKVRTVNQDQFLIAELHKVIRITGTSLPQRAQESFDSGAKAMLMLVADGVGGSAAGEEASQLTLDTVVTYVSQSMRCFYKLGEAYEGDLLKELAGTVQQSHKAVRQQAAETAEMQGMATTLTLAHVLWPSAYVVQIGDSRCYHARADRIAQVTEDQTVAQELVGEGLLDADSVAQSPLSNVLSRAIGNEDEQLRPEITKTALAEGDTLLLCTDGLTKHLSDSEILDAVRNTDSAEAACRRLVDGALAEGGTDNVTVIVATFG